MKIFLILIICYFLICSTEQVELNDNNWTNVFDGKWMILLYAPWCGACQSVKPKWDDFSKNYDGKVASIDITKNPIAAGSFVVSKLPTIYHVENGVFRQYNGERSSSAFADFYNNDYIKVNPVEWYLSPKAYHMRILGYLFKFSQIISTWQHHMETQYSWPSWLCYGLIGMGILFMGALIAIILVCVCDMFMPPRPQVQKYWKKEQNRPSPYIKKETDSDNDTFPDISDVAKVRKGVLDIDLDSGDSKEQLDIDDKKHL